MQILYHEKLKKQPLQHKFYIMGFIDEVKNCFGLEYLGEPVYRAVIFGDSGIYLENVKGISAYSKESVEVLLKRGRLKILGKDLYIKKYCLGDLVIVGVITGVERC